MAKFYGKIGYADQVVVRPGVYEDKIVERKYYGDVTRDSAKWRNNDTIHGKLTAANTISILADGYAIDHIFAMRYVEWSGSLWTIADVQVERPRLNLRLGEVYNGPVPESNQKN